MKKLKATEILTLLQRVDDVSTRQMQKEIQEALVELDELTQEKICERCEHSKDIAAHLNIVICTYDDDDMPSENGTTSLKEGMQDRHTPKE